MKYSPILWIQTEYCQILNSPPRFYFRAVMRTAPRKTIALCGTGIGLSMAMSSASAFR